MVCTLPHFFLLVMSHWSTHSYTGVVASSPACRRALQTVVSLLEQDGHEVTAMFVSGHLSCTHLTIHRTQ